MTVTDIPALPDVATATGRFWAQLRRLGDVPQQPPAEADLTPQVPTTGGVPAVWVSARGHADLAAGVLLYVHGGGFEHRKPPLMNLLALRLSQATGRPVLVVHYRLAPADPYPAALDDVVAAYRGLLDHGVPAGRIAVLGESSGGTLVLSALQVLRDAGTPLPATAVAVSAVTDLTLASASIDANAATDAGVHRTMLTRLVRQYLGSARPDLAPQSPLHGELGGLPPLLLGVGGAEALLDDTLRFADAATAAGCLVQVDVYQGMPHAFQILTLDKGDPTGRVVLDRLATWIAANAGHRVAG